VEVKKGRGVCEQRKKGAGTKIARLALQKLRLEILGLRSRRTDWRCCPAWDHPVKVVGG
jgi:hypothetical protein